MKHDNRGHPSEPHIDLDHRHAFAVCQGVGERLRDAMDLNDADMSPRLSAMLARLPELDAADSPSLVPSMSEAH